MAENQEEIKKLEEQISHLKRENQDLKDKLVSFKSLDEEMIGKRVFDAAYNRLKTYITVGGIATVIIAFFGFDAVRTFVENKADMVATRMDTKAITNLAVKRLDIQLATIEKKVSTQITVKGNRELDTISRKLADSTNYLFRIVSNKLNAINQPNSYLPANQRKSNKLPTNLVVPSNLDLTNLVGPVQNQGQEGSVTGFVLADALSEDLRLQTGKFLTFSARYIYNSLNNNVDSGVPLPDGLNFLIRKGAIAENFWKYKQGEVFKPVPSDLNNVPHYKIDYYNNVDISISKFKNILASKKIIIAGMAFYTEFESPSVAKSGMLPSYKPDFVLAGGHATTIVGYDDNTKLFKVRNSWGSDWGDHGYCYLGYADLNKIINYAYVLGNVIIPKS